MAMPPEVCDSKISLRSQIRHRETRRIFNFRLPIEHRSRCALQLKAISLCPLGRRGLFVGTGAFSHYFRFSIFLGNSCFTNPFFDPLLCRQFFFPNRFLFPQPVFLPYPVYIPPYLASLPRSIRIYSCRATLKASAVPNAKPCAKLESTYTPSSA